MAREFSGNARRAVALLVQIIDGANVVEATTGDKVSAGGVGAGHDPGGSQGNGVDLVCGICIPDNELAVL